MWFPRAKRIRRPSRYLPHQGDRERRRRLRQVRAGKLSGPNGFVSEEARYAAHGLTAPSELQLVKP